MIGHNLVLTSSFSSSMLELLIKENNYNEKQTPKQTKKEQEKTMKNGNKESPVFLKKVRKMREIVAETV